MPSFGLRVRWNYGSLVGVTSLYQRTTRVATMSEKETYEAPELTEIGEVAELTREFGPNCSEMHGGAGVVFAAGRCSGKAFS